MLIVSCQLSSVFLTSVENTANCNMKYSISPHSQEGAMPCAPTMWFNYLKNAVANG